MGRDDRLFVYFAGHGETLATRTGGEEGYILPVDADPKNLPLTAVAMDDFQRFAKRLPAKHYFFVMDACFSGFAATRGGSEKAPTQQHQSAALREPVVQVLTAGRKGERSIEEGGHGLFTRRVLEGLRGLADSEGQGVISAGQLAAWVEQRVVRDSRGQMTPQFSKLDGEGHFLFFLSAVGSQARPPAIDLSGTFTGMIQGQSDATPYSIPITATFVQRRKNVSGTWTTTLASGTMTGLVDGTAIRAFRVEQTAPCAATFHGLGVSHGSNNNSVSGSYRGTDCSSGAAAVSATFTLSRVLAEARFDDRPLDPPDLLNIAMSYLYQLRYENALDYLDQLLRAAERSGNEALEAQALVFIGIAQAGQRRFDDALKAYLGSLGLLEKLQDENMQGIVMLQLGVLQFEQGDAVSSVTYFERSRAIAEKLGLEPLLARVLYYLGLLAARQGQQADALNLLDRAASLADRHSIEERSTIRQKRDEVRASVPR
jgi:tetratricopeptide (TPR) repeat protein